MVETNIIWVLGEVKSAKRELVHGKHRLKVAVDVCTFMEHNRSIVEKAR